jgi:methylated-DNA-protein-cysteine methyltransferase-like protein
MSAIKGDYLCGKWVKSAKKMRNPPNNMNFFEQVYLVVKQVPQGKITTYGIIAKQLGTRDARRVGHALHANKSTSVPCHRVVNKNGGLAKSFGFGGEWEQAKRLEVEGVEITNNKVDLERYLCHCESDVTSDEAIPSGSPRPSGSR